MKFLSMIAHERRLPVTLSHLVMLAIVCPWGAFAHAEEAAAPLSGEAYEAAQAAYSAYAAKDYATSAQQAQRAIALRPELLRLYLLLIDADSAAGNDAAAWQVDRDATKRFGDQESLQSRRTYIGARLSVPVSLAALDAAHQGALDRAAVLARQAVDYAPHRNNPRLQLIAILLAQGDLAGAESVAAAGLSAEHADLMALVLHGYLRAARGDTTAADADFTRALADTQASARNQRVARVIIADVWLARDEAQRALDLLAPMPILGDEIDAEIMQRRHQAEQQVAHGAAATPLDPHARPTIYCYSETYGAVCDVDAADAADAGRAARRAYAEAFAQGKKDLAVNDARQAVAAAPDIAQHRVDLINALMNDGAKQEADAEARTVVADGLLGALLPLTAAYVASDAGDSRDAIDYFKQADAAHALAPAAHADAAYAALQSHDNTDAELYLKQSIDIVDPPVAANAQNKNPPVFTAQQVQDMRNSYADLTRDFGFDMSVNSRGASVPGGVPASSSGWASNNSSIGAEAYWRPFGSLDNQMFEVYARTYELFGVKGQSAASGISSLDAAFGARIKPFSAVDAVFAFERIEPVGSRTSADWLARAAYSGGFGTDRRMDVPSWWTLQTYAEVGHYMVAGNNYGTSSIEFGRTYRLTQTTENWTVFPYAVAGADYNNSINREIATGLGVGISSRYWFRDSHYASARSFIDATVQYRWKLTGDDRARGLFLGATLSY